MAPYRFNRCHVINLTFPLFRSPLLQGGRFFYILFNFVRNPV